MIGLICTSATDDGGQCSGFNRGSRRERLGSLCTVAQLSRWWPTLFAGYSTQESIACFEGEGNFRQASGCPTRRITHQRERVANRSLADTSEYRSE